MNKDAARDVSQNLVFDHPTIQQLAEAVRALAALETISARRSLAEHITELVEKYSADLPQVKQAQPPQNRVVLLTGSTGNIGSHILAALLADEHVLKVYTLDRNVPGENPKDRLTAAFKQRGLPVELLADARLIVLGGDLSAEAFGLDKPILEQVSDKPLPICYSLMLNWTAQIFREPHRAQRLEGRLQPRTKLFRDPYCRYSQACGLRCITTAISFSAFHFLGIRRWKVERIKWTGTRDRSR